VGLDGFKMITKFAQPVCSECATRIRRVKVFLLSTFAVLIALGVLLVTPDAPRDGLIGMSVAGLIMSAILIALNFFDPARWFQDRFSFAGVPSAVS
jgi:hypothetical protein